MPNEIAAHTKVMRLERQRLQIKDLETEVARLKAGARPAWHVRDLVLTVLLRISADLKNPAIEREPLIKDLDRLIKTLSENLPGDVKVPKPPQAAKDNSYKPLDHGPRDNAAAAPQYRTPEHPK